MDGRIQRKFQCICHVNPFEVFPEHHLPGGPIIFSVICICKVLLLIWRSNEKEVMRISKSTVLNEDSKPILYIGFGSILKEGKLLYLWVLVD
jgi:hypothetical protein